MERRTFLAGAATAALTATGCTRKDSGTPARTPAPADWAALARDLDGALVRPGGADWPTAHRLHNTRFDDLEPAAVAYVAHADDIRTVLAHARAVPVAIRNGGHSYAGWSSGDGRLIVDVSALDTVRASAGTAVVGAKLIDVHRALAAKGVTVPGGS